MKKGAKTAARIQVWITIVLCAIALTLSSAVLLFFLKGTPQQENVPMQNSGVELQSAETGSTPQPTSEPTPEPPSPEELRIQAVLETFGDRCTGSEPQIKDPDTWNANGKALFEQLTSDPYYIERNLDMSERKGCPYMLAVNRAASTVNVLALDADGNYTVPYMAFVCSGGEKTPMGYYVTKDYYNWCLLSGPCYGQYAVRFWGPYLFHSVPYYTQHQDDLEYDQYNMLGGLASLGCVRLSVVDIKWIYNNCPVGTRVVTYDIPDDPGPMGKPGTIAIDPADESLRGWDPTDPDPRNPWDDKYLPGTAIRSDAAWEEYNAAMADGRWDKSINKTPLQGYSTDSNIEGTRG